MRKTHQLVSPGTWLVTVLALLPLSAQPDNPVETGAVAWGRNVETALEASKRSHKPVFLLFQEVPGCSGCQTFGREVLRQPLLVEAIETCFEPVVIYNNRSTGHDRQMLQRFGEPGWNYQVVRFLNADGRDLIPRKDRVWKLGPLATRMVKALRTAKRPVPPYLALLALEHDQANLKTCALAMPCFWTGEYRLGQLDGVVTTEAGWLDGREVTLVRYREDLLSLKDLVLKAGERNCAQHIYLPEKAGQVRLSIPTGTLDDSYRPAPASDQKKQVQRWADLRRVPNLTPAQWTKLNAFAPHDRDRALRWLSPSQRETLKP